MAFEVLVYEANGASGRGLYGHVLGTQETFLLTTVESDWNAYTTADGGFVYQGDNTNRFDDTLVHYGSGGTTIINQSAQGDYLDDPEWFLSFAGESLFSVRFGDGLYVTNGANAPTRIIDEDIDYIFNYDGAIIGWNSRKIYRIEDDFSVNTLIDRDNYKFSSIDYVFELDGGIWFRGFDPNTHYYYKLDANDNVIRTNVQPVSGGDNVRFWQSGVGETQFFYFFGNREAGIELYASDGTVSGTGLVKDINPGDGSSFFGIGYPITIDDTLFFVADDGGSTDEELWISDGTATGTFALSGTGTNAGDLSFGLGFQPIVVGDKIFFRASGPDEYGSQLYVSDGTQSGTQLVPIPYSLSNGVGPSDFVTDGEFLYFTVNSADTDVGERSYWRSDGTAAGTFPVSDPGGSAINPPNLASIVTVDFEDLAFLSQETFSRHGTNGDDGILGTELREIIYGFGGDDVIAGGANNDIIFGGDDNDIVYGASGFDYLSGGAGFDTAFLDHPINEYFFRQLKDSKYIEAIHALETELLDVDIEQFFFDFLSRGDQNLYTLDDLNPITYNSFGQTLGWFYGWNVNWFTEGWLLGWNLGWTNSWNVAWHYGWYNSNWGWTVGWYYGWGVGWHIGWRYGWYNEGWQYGWTVSWYYGWG
ncbi:MAG: hypothetical protein AAFQ10_12550 [Pseudomonadota bacterium]